MRPVIDARAGDAFAVDIGGRDFAGLLVEPADDVEAAAPFDFSDSRRRWQGVVAAPVPGRTKRYVEVGEPDLDRAPIGAFRVDSEDEAIAPVRDAHPQQRDIEQICPRHRAGCAIEQEFDHKMLVEVGGIVNETLDTVRPDASRLADDVTGARLSVNERRCVHDCVSRGISSSNQSASARAALLLQRRGSSARSPPCRAIAPNDQSK